jgi:hypothetical protein
MIVHCKMGGRSAKAVALFTGARVPERVQPEGGILAWIDRIRSIRSRNTENLRISSGRAGVLVIEVRPIIHLPQGLNA